MVPHGTETAIAPSMVAWPPSHGAPASLALGRAHAFAQLAEISQGLGSDVIVEESDIKSNRCCPFLQLLRRLGLNQDSVAVRFEDASRVPSVGVHGFSVISLSTISKIHSWDNRSPFVRQGLGRSIGCRKQL